MGGFMINGIGAADSFKPLQDLGEHYCNYCKKNRIFSLMAIKRKIRVVYIPTLTVTTKHGITCKNCKNGRYISQEEYMMLVDGRGEMELKDNEILVKRKKQSNELPDPEKQKLLDQLRASQSRNETSAGDTKTSAQHCPACGKEQPFPGGFCAYCGETLKEPEKKEAPAAAEKQKTVCPACKKEQPAEGDFCAYCGESLKKPEEKKAPAPAPAKRKTVCPACKKKQPTQGDFCAYCGTSLTQTETVQTPPPKPVKDKTACPVCRKEQPTDGDFCAYCGASLKEPQKQEEPVQEQKPVEQKAVCPACKKEQPMQGDFCAYCGAAMHPEVRIEAEEMKTLCVCPVCKMEQVVQGDFCAYCGTPWEQSEEAAPVAEEKQPQKQEEEPVQESEPTTGNVCPSCGKEQPVPGEFCAFCGETMQQAENTAKTSGEESIYTPMGADHEPVPELSAAEQAAYEKFEALMGLNSLEEFDAAMGFDPLEDLVEVPVYKMEPDQKITSTAEESAPWEEDEEEPAVQEVEEVHEEKNAPTQMFCTECGMKQKKPGKFCAYCGSSMAD